MAYPSDSRSEPFKESIDGLIGGFGLGFLSAFVVADRVEVLTQKLGDASGWLWMNTGSRWYELSPSNVAATGTKVTVYVKPSAAALLQGREVEDVVRKQADMLRTPVYLNGHDIPVNRGRMPWESPAGDQEGLALACLTYLETHTRAPVLAVFPFTLGEEHSHKAQGVLYIASKRVVALDGPRAVEVYLDRMLIRQNAPEILPQWASFVDGAISSSSLQSTSARDNILLDSSFEQLREELGDVIIDQLDSVRRTDSDRFSRILERHALRIRAACLACEAFLDKFEDAVDWHVNSSETESVRLRLPDILNLLRRPTNGEPARLLCFGGGNADHFFEMANRAGTMIIDASGSLEMQLLEVIANRRAVHLVRVDREDPEELFTIAGGESHPVVKLARAMSSLVCPLHGRLDVSARLFEPAYLPAILRRGEDAEEAQPMKVTINAANEFVKRLAAIERYEEDDVRQLMTGLYNSAVLSSGAVTGPDASYLHTGYIRLMDESLGHLERQSVG